MKKKKKKVDEEVFTLSFQKETYKKETVTNFNYAWKHPIITCRLCIKYFWKWITSVDSPLAPTVRRYYIFFFALVLRSFVWLYFGFVVNVLINGKEDGIRVLTEIPMAAGMSFLSIFALLLAIRFVIAFLEIIRVVKVDNRFLYGVGVFLVYGFIAVVAAGTAIQ